jgi:hypothetical protein
MSPRRRRALVEALRGLEAAVASLPPAADRNALADALVTRWRAAVRGVVTPVEEAIRAGRIENRAIAARWLHAAAIPVRDAFVAEAPAAVAPLAPHGPLVLGVPEPISHGPVDVAGGLGGAGAALREIRGIAARWLLDGEVALREWVLAAFHDPGPAAARETLARVIPAALRALDLGVRPA